MAKTDDEFHNSISNSYLNEDFKKCISIWEGSNQIKFNELREEDILLLEMVSNSYIEEQYFYKARKLLNILIKKAKKDIEKNMDKYDFYLLQKSEIFRKENKLYLEYLVLAEREKLNYEPNFMEYITAYEKYFSKRIVDPIFVLIPIIIYLFLIFNETYLHFIILPRTIYFSILISGLIYFLFGLFFRKLFEKFIFYLLKKCTLVFRF